MYFWPCKTAGERWAVGGWRVTGAHGCPSLLPGAVPGCPLMLRHLLCPEQLWKRICPVPAPLSTSGCAGRVPTLPPAGRPSLVPPPTPSLSPLGKENCSYVFRPNARSLQTPLEVWDRKPGVLQVSGGPPGRARGGVCCLSPGVGAAPRSARSRYRGIGLWCRRQRDTPGPGGVTAHQKRRDPLGKPLIRR